MRFFASASSEPSGKCILGHQSWQACKTCASGERILARTWARLCACDARHRFRNEETGKIDYFKMAASANEYASFVKHAQHTQHRSVLRAGWQVVSLATCISIGGEEILWLSGCQVCQACLACWTEWERLCASKVDGSMRRQKCVE